MIQRKITKVTQSSWHPGFLGTGHRASAVFEHVPYEETDPFIVFMDDRLNLPGGDPVGGPHPHAGFEILTLILKGNEKDWKTGSLELLTTGKGIIHTEEITAQQDVHILQVWLALPPEKRWVEPSWQRLTLEQVPVIRNENYEIRVYSGSSKGLASPIRSYTPLTLLEFRMRNDQSVHQQLPAGQNGLIYVLEGSVQAGDKIIKAGQAGWLDKAAAEEGQSEIQFISRSDDTHFVLYTAAPHHVPLVMHGPFGADTMDDIRRLYKEYRNGEMVHVNDLPADQKVEYRLQDS